MNETNADPLEIFKINSNRNLNISSEIECSENSAGFSYQACDGGWSTLTGYAAWGLRVTQMWSNSAYFYMLEVRFY